jgi:hypothetical protein
MEKEQNGSIKSERLFNFTANNFEKLLDRQ